MTLPARGDRFLMISVGSIEIMSLICKHRSSAKAQLEGKSFGRASCIKQKRKKSRFWIFIFRDLMIKDWMSSQGAKRTQGKASIGLMLTKVNATGDALLD